MRPTQHIKKVTHIVRVIQPTFNTDATCITIMQCYAEQKHLGCKKAQGQSEATMQTGSYSCIKNL